jgi:hypothetical protein
VQNTGHPARRRPAYGQFACILLAFPGTAPFPDFQKFGTFQH